MFAVLLPALWTVLAWLVRAVLVKAVIYGFMLVAVTEIAQYLTGKVAFGDFNLSANFSQFSPGMWYFFDLFKVGTGLTLVLSAYVSRFFIRRLPFIG